MATPSLIWHITSSTNFSNSGDNFKIPILDPGAGNCLILAMTYPTGSPPTITDTNNTWSSTPVVTANSSTFTSSIFVLANANAGRSTLTVSFGTPVQPFQYTISSFTNIATVSPANGTANGTSAGADLIPPSLATGSFTPGNNNALGGNLVWCYFAVSSQQFDNVTSFVAGGSFTLLDADISWTANPGVPHACQYFVQATSASINPSITATNDTTNSYNCLAIALKAASAGTPIPAGIYINKLLHQTYNAPVVGAANVLQFPSIGNLLVFTTPVEGNQVVIASITDPGGTWIQVPGDIGMPYIFYSINRTPNPNLTLTLHITSIPAPGSSVSIRFYDISGASTNPFDTFAGHDNTQVDNQTSITDYPIITPTNTNGLVIAQCGLFTGPGLSVTSPAGAVFDMCTYTGEVDSDTMENADLCAHFFNSNASTLHWNWTFTSISNNSMNAIAAAFIAAPVAPSVSSVPFGIIGLGSSEW